MVSAISWSQIQTPESILSPMLTTLPEDVKTGILLCINGTGIQNSWIKKIVGANLSYDELNALGQQAPIGSKGLKNTFGNGAERMLNNRIVQSHIQYIDFNKHGRAEIIRLVRKELHLVFARIRHFMRKRDQFFCNQSRIYLIFSSALYFAAHLLIQLLPRRTFESDGSKGAALGAGIGIGYYSTPKKKLLVT